mmetsp:Transcript_10034/g.25509  ORF Transcript_10034/g.25509 Transcript_10034/m.25509 type:complete len:206 (-) Transcript_10034:201-818(-)
MTKYGSNVPQSRQMTQALEMPIPQCREVEKFGIRTSILRKADRKSSILETLPSVLDIAAASVAFEQASQYSIRSELACIVVALGVDHGTSMPVRVRTIADTLHQDTALRKRKAWCDVLVALGVMDAKLIAADTELVSCWGMSLDSSELQTTQSLYFEEQAQQSQAFEAACLEAISLQRDQSRRQAAIQRARPRQSRLGSCAVRLQ